MPELRTSDGVRLHYVVDGPDDAPVVVLLHGLGSDGQADQPLVDAIGDRLRVVRLDLRGHGRSEPLTDPARYGWFDRSAADVGELLDALGLETAALQGGSLGAAVALATVLARPERVRALGLSSPAIGAGTGLANPVAATFAEGVGELGLVGMLDAVTESKLLPAADEEMAAARENYARQDDVSMRACVNALTRARLVDNVSELTVIGCPTMVAARRGDPLHPFELAEEVAAHIPGARLVVDDGSVPMHLRPSAAADLIADFHTQAARRTAIRSRSP
ncbi:MAG: alpha/beta fold hydrolase [Acidimicrobiia bacterium]